MLICKYPPQFNCNPKLLVIVWFAMKPMSTFLLHVFLFFFFFFFFFFSPQLLTLSIVNSAYVYYSRSHKLHFLATFLLKMGLTTLFTHLKIISLQCFQFQFSVSAKISSIQTHPQLAISLILLFLFQVYRSFAFLFIFSVPRNQLNKMIVKKCIQPNS